MQETLFDVKQIVRKSRVKKTKSLVGSSVEASSRIVGARFEELQKDANDQGEKE